RTRRLDVSHAFHSPHVDDILDEFRAVAASVSFGVPTIPVVSTVTGDLVPVSELRSPDYWTRQIRATVRVLDAVRSLEKQGATVFVEVGPDAVLTPLVQSCLTHDAVATTIALTRAGRPEVDTVVRGMALAHVRGAALDTASFFRGATQVE